MAQRNGLHPFQKGLHQLSVITTDLAESETLIRAIAEKEQQRDPHAFAGKTPLVYFKFSYVPPCEPFKELRRLILQVHDNTGLRANFKGIVAIEATEWIGHEREEYFSVVLKFLYDHSDLWRSAMILTNCSQPQLQRFLSACARWITPRAFDASLFSDPKTLDRIISQALLDHGHTLDPEAGRLLISALTRDELKDARSMTLIDRVAGEITLCRENSKEISPENIQSYLREPYCALTMLAGKPLYEERSRTIENETLQLRS